jgi:hypothetical protein
VKQWLRTCDVVQQRCASAFRLNDFACVIRYVFERFGSNPRLANSSSTTAAQKLVSTAAAAPMSAWEVPLGIVLTVFGGIALAVQAGVNASLGNHITKPVAGAAHTCLKLLCPQNATLAQ